jgi:hypothetical protein
MRCTNPSHHFGGRDLLALREVAFRVEDCAHMLAKMLELNSARMFEQQFGAAGEARRLEAYQVMQERRGDKGQELAKVS